MLALDAGYSLFLIYLLINQITQRPFRRPELSLILSRFRKFPKPNFIGTCKRCNWLYGASGRSALAYLLYLTLSKKTEAESLRGAAWRAP